MQALKRIPLLLGLGAISILPLCQVVVAGQTPPEPVEWSVDVAANTFKNCPFAIRVTVKGKGAVLNLPGNRLIITAPYQNVTIGNSDTDNPATPEYDPTSQVTLNITGASHQITTPNGDVVTTATGRNLLGDPEAGLVLAIGEFSYAFDAGGTLIQPLQGKGQLQDVCAMVAQ
jgi:hypothetical protein